MKKLLIISIYLLLVSCGSFMPSEQFFITVSTKDVTNVPIDSISFRKSYIEDDCVSCGTVSEPLFDCDIKYDTLSHYTVIVMGKIVFDNNCQNGQYRKVDSIEINRLVIDRQHFPREFYSDLDHKWSRNTTWEKCPLPKSILKKIRNDFLKRKKYIRYNFKDPNVKSISESYCYRLY